MDLKTYLKSLDQSQRGEFSKRCETSLSHLRFVAYGAKVASADLAMVIEDETDGLVTAEEIRPQSRWHVIRGKAA